MKNRRRKVRFERPAPAPTAIDRNARSMGWIFENRPGADAAAAAALTNAA